MLRRGLAIGSQHLLTVQGRRSGQPRRTPVSIVTLDGARYIVAALDHAAWVGNVRESRSGSLTRAGRTENVVLAELPTAERGPIIRAFLSQVRGGVRFFGSQTADEIVARADRYPVFKVSATPVR